MTLNINQHPKEESRLQSRISRFFLLEQLQNAAAPPQRFRHKALFSLTAPQHRDAQISPASHSLVRVMATAQRFCSGFGSSYWLDLSKTALCRPRVLAGCISEKPSVLPVTCCSAMDMGRWSRYYVPLFFWWTGVGLIGFGPVCESVSWTWVSLIPITAVFPGSA